MAQFENNFSFFFGTFLSKNCICIFSSSPSDYININNFDNRNNFRKNGKKNYNRIRNSIRGRVFWFLQEGLLG